MKNGQPSYVTPEEAARFLRVTRRTVYTWLRVGKIRAEKIQGIWAIPETVLNTAVTIGRFRRIP